MAWVQISVHNHAGRSAAGRTPSTGRMYVSYACMDGCTYVCIICMYVCMHAQVHDPRADGEHVPDRVARRSSRSRRPLESGDRETPNLCGEAKGVEFTLETRQMEQVRVMPHRLHMRRACGLGSNSSVLRSRLRSRRLSKGGCAAASALLSAGGEHASTESMPLCDILVYWRLLSFHKKKIGPHFHHTSTRGVPSPEPARRRWMEMCSWRRSSRSRTVPSS